MGMKSKTVHLHLRAGMLYDYGKRTWWAGLPVLAGLADARGWQDWWGSQLLCAWHPLAGRLDQLRIRVHAHISWPNDLQEWQPPGRAKMTAMSH